MVSIPIVMTVDNNYIIQVAVTIFSIYKNNSADTRIQITILCGEDFKEENKEWLIDTVNALKNIEVLFCVVDPRRFDAVEGVGHVSLCSYYRLLIPEIINEDKCLFLDGDLIVQSSLKGLYGVDIEEQYLAAALDVGFAVDPDWALYHTKRANYENLQGYFNAGVMLLNLKKMREDEIQNKFFNEIANNYFYMDQDVLNKVCKGKVKIISNKYNCFHKMNLNRCYRFSEDDLPAIVHFAGPYKPWNNVRVRYAKLWWNCAKEILNDDAYKDFEACAILSTKKNDWSYVVHKAFDEKEIVIVGYSLIGVHVHDSLRLAGVKGRIAFCDSSSKKHNLTDEVVNYIDDLVYEKQNALWIISSQNYHKEIFNNLIEKGISKERIINYFDKQQGYYEYIDEAFLEDELHDKIKMMTGELLWHIK